MQQPHRRVSAKDINNLLSLSTQPPDGVQNRQVGLACPVLFQTLSSTDPNVSIRSDALGERIDQSGFADAGFSGNKYDLTLSAKHLLEPPLHLRQDSVAPNDSLSGISDTLR